MLLKFIWRKKLPITITITEVIKASPGILVVKTDDGKTIRREGGTVSWRCNNPGNMKLSPLSRTLGAIGQDAGGHAVFPTIEHGNQARYTLLFREGSRYLPMTIKEMTEVYAPVADGGKPKSYTEYLEQSTGINRNTRIQTLTVGQRMSLIHHMMILEGWKEGKDIVISG